MRILLFSILILAELGCKEPPTAPIEKIPGVKRDFKWSVDTLLSNEHQVDFFLDCLWGTSSNNVWGAGSTESSLWHFDGDKWHSVLTTPSYNWPYFGSDEYGNYSNYPSSVTGFDSNHVIVTCNRNYLSADTSIASVMRWNGSTWEDVPFTNKRPRWFRTLKNENNYRAWGLTALGRIVKYENGVCTTEPAFTEERYGNYSMAVTDDGYVYVNSQGDSIKDGNLQGIIYDFFERDLTGKWSLIEHKAVIGSYYDEKGLGVGVDAIGNRVFTENRGIWEMLGAGWRKISSALVDNVGGGSCLIDENNLWFYHQQDLFNYNGKDWEKIEVPILAYFPGGFLYGQGWSDGEEIFLSLLANGTYVLHGQ